MATAAPTPQLPLFYHQLEPLSSNVHADYRARQVDNALFAVNAHAVPITVDEFVSAQRSYPIVFSAGDNPVPLVLMGLNDGVNVFMGDDGKLLGEAYVPAYIRRYPYMLARVRPDAQELSLCFDPTSGMVGPYEDGKPLFEEGKPTETTKSVLKFCEEFELAAQRTTAFVGDLKEANLLMDGEVSLQPPGAEKPFLYRGFQMISDERLRDLRGDQLRKMSQNGMLPLIHAHLFSLGIVREIFGKQVSQGKMPRQEAGIPATADA
jgi:hypothetical protein